MTSTTFEPATLQANSNAAHNVFVSDVTRHTTAEDIANTKVQDQFGRRPRVNATEDDRRRILSLRRRLNFAHQIAMPRFAGPEAFVTILHLLDNSVRSHFVALRRRIRNNFGRFGKNASCLGAVPLT
jgi:hypothetical protein